jgi:hypothetical protein
MNFEQSAISVSKPDEKKKGPGGSGSSGRK